ncbi:MULTISPECIES: hypothetical protein [Candidatus Ichthyocystis]|uniref:hypothetical protein n=1 Tax=Candidatus Ichthyocystis TaxID=2929841 RepID=UPI000B8629A1|nr:MULTISPECIES: hypothetical protein [Ichthyocystis]
MMKKTFLANALVLLGSIISPTSFAGAVSSSDNLVGYMSLEDPLVRPIGISVKSDGTMIVTAAGDLFQESDSGQIWTASPGSTKFYKNVISPETHEINILTSSAYSESHDSLYVCSIPAPELATNIAPAVIEFKKNEAGEYVWTSVMNFQEGTLQCCKGISIIGNTLFALNPLYSSPKTPALYAADLAEPESSRKLAVIQTYGDLGFSDDDTWDQSPLSMAISDITTSKSPQKDSNYHLYLLDVTHSKIDSVVFGKGKNVDDMDRISIEQMPFDGDTIKSPTALASLDNKNFFISGSIDVSRYNAVNHELATIYKLTYRDNNPSPKMSLLGEEYSTIAEMIISKDRFNKGIGNSLFATLVTQDSKGVYNVAEYRIDSNEKTNHASSK